MAAKNEFLDQVTKNAIGTLRRNPGVAGAGKHVSEMTLAEVEAFEKSIGMLPDWGETTRRRAELARLRANGGEDKGWV